jgi:hypothetical protein
MRVKFEASKWAYDERVLPNDLTEREVQQICENWSKHALEDVEIERAWYVIDESETKQGEKMNYKTIAPQIGDVVKISADEWYLYTSVGWTRMTPEQMAEVGE